jgi:hypothetical protein
MRINPPRPPGPDHFLVQLIVSTSIDGFWTESRCYSGSWLAIHRFLRWSGSCQAQVKIYQGDQARQILFELRRQTALYRLMKTAQPNN